MTVSSETIRILYDGDGVTVVFPYTWKIYASSDLQVVYRDSVGAETVLTLDTHYTVSGVGNANGGNVTLIGYYAANPPASETNLLVILDLPFTQTFDYLENDPFPAESHEELADKGVKLCQILNERLDRTIQIPITSSETDVEITEEALDALQALDDLFDFSSGDAGKLIKVNATEDGFEVSTLVEESTQFDFGSKDIVTTGDLTAANVEDGATADQTGAEIKALYEAEADTNAFTDTLKTKLDGIESAATADQTGAEIKTAYEAEADTNAFTDADHSKLDAIEASADVTDAENVEDAITGAGAETDPTDAGVFPVIISAVLKKITWANIKATLETYFDTLYAAITHATEHKTGGSDILYVPRTYVWFIPGTVTADTEQGPTYRLKRACTVEDVELHVQTAPTGATLIIDINEDGTTIFSTKPEIDISAETEDDNHVISDSALAAGAELTMDIDQIGSTVAGSDLTVLLHVKEFVI